MAPSAIILYAAKSPSSSSLCSKCSAWNSGVKKVSESSCWMKLWRAHNAAGMCVWTSMLYSGVSRRINHCCLRTPKIHSTTFRRFACRRLNGSFTFCGLVHSVSITHGVLLSYEFLAYHRFTCHHSFRWYWTPWYGMRSASDPPKPASARRNFPWGIYKSWVCASCHMVASTIKPSHPINVYVNIRSKSHMKRQFCEIYPFLFHMFGCSSSSTNVWIWHQENFEEIIMDYNPWQTWYTSYINLYSWPPLIAYLDL